MRKIVDARDARACVKAARTAGLSLGAWARRHGVDGRSLHAWSVNLGLSPSALAKPGLIEPVPQGKPCEGVDLPENGSNPWGAEAEVVDVARPYQEFRFRAILGSLGHRGPQCGRNERGRLGGRDTNGRAGEKQAEPQDRARGWRGRVHDQAPYQTSVDQPGVIARLNDSHCRCASYPPAFLALVGHDRNWRDRE